MQRLKELRDQCNYWNDAYKHNVHTRFSILCSCSADYSLYRMEQDEFALKNEHVPAVLAVIHWLSVQYTTPTSAFICF